MRRHGRCVASDVVISALDLAQGVLRAQQCSAGMVVPAEVVIGEFGHGDASAGKSLNIIMRHGACGWMDDGEYLFAISMQDI